jgi:hypothetical protein
VTLALVAGADAVVEVPVDPGPCSPLHAGRQARAAARERESERCIDALLTGRPGSGPSCRAPGDHDLRRDAPHDEQNRAAKRRYDRERATRNVEHGEVRNCDQARERGAQERTGEAATAKRLSFTLVFRADTRTLCPLTLCPLRGAVL